MNVGNSLLAQLPQHELESIAPLLMREWLPADMMLLSVEERLQHAYFPESAIASVVTCGDNDRTSYVGLYGYEGFGSVATLLGASVSGHREIVQSAGYAFRLRVSDLTDMMAVLPEFRRRLHCFAHVFLMQVGYTAFANGCTRIDQRLARWLLMYQDRMRASSLAITHQRLSEILGVRRSGVTEALHILEGVGLIRAHRGLIDILDRRRLAEMTAGSYGRPEEEYRRLL